MRFRSAVAAIAMIFVAVLAFSAANAGAATNDDSYVGAEVLSATATNTAAVPEAAAVKSATVSNSALAFTGSDALGLTIIGAVAVAGGASLLLVRRRATN